MDQATRCACAANARMRAGAFPIHLAIAGIRCSLSALNGRSAGCRNRLILADWLLQN
jgi:hypothetical protein